MMIQLLKQIELGEEIDKKYKSIEENKITSGTKEWADSNVNCISGCSNNCKYCYAKKMAIRFGRATEKSWPKMKIRQHDVEKGYNKRKGRIMFPTSHDIPEKSTIKNACFIVLEKLLVSDNEILAHEGEIFLGLLVTRVHRQLYSSLLKFIVVEFENQFHDFDSPSDVIDKSNQLILSCS